VECGEVASYLLADPRLAR